MWKVTPSSLAASQASSIGRCCSDCFHCLPFDRSKINSFGLTAVRPIGAGLTRHGDYVVNGQDFEPIRVSLVCRFVIQADSLGAVLWYPFAQVIHKTVIVLSPCRTLVCGSAKPAERLR